MELMAIQKEDALRMSREGDLPNYSLAGTGKTLSTLEAFRLSGHDTCLVLCPIIAMQMWKEEFENWIGGKVVTIRPGQVSLPKDADCVICSYDMAAGGMRLPLLGYFRERNRGALILDEAHAARVHTTKRSAAIFGDKTDGVGGFMECFDQVWSLTGTPIYRYADDIWGQLVALYPDVFYKYKVLDYQDFVRNFCVSQLKKYHARMAPRQVIVRSQNEPILRHMLYEEIKAIRRMSAPDLPELVKRNYYPKLGAVPAEYGAMLNKMSDEQIMRALVSPSKDDDLQKGWQVVSLAKVSDVSAYVADSVLTSPVLVGVWHDAVGEAYLHELRDKHGLSVERVYGATPQLTREEIRNRFNAGELDVIVGQMAAMGVSWNLQKAASHVIIAQDHYSPAVVEQFYKRVYRTGQTSKVLLDLMTSEHPIDVAVRRIRERKAVSNAKILD